MILTVGSRGWRACADHDRARIPIGPPERVAPRTGEPNPSLVQYVIEVLGAVPGSFDDDDATARGVEDGGEIVRPPFDCDVSALIVSLSEAVSRSGPVHLEEHYVARSQACGRLVDGTRRTKPTVRYRAGDGLGRDANNANGVDVAAVLAKHRRAMVAPVDAGELSSRNDTTLVLR